MFGKKNSPNGLEMVILPFMPYSTVTKTGGQWYLNPYPMELKLQNHV